MAETKKKTKKSTVKAEDPSAERKGGGAGRTRNYATVVYPDSAPDGWQDTLSAHFVPCFVSPLHDQDINPGGEPKKPHYHVLVMFDSVKTKEQAEQIFALIGGVGCEVVNSTRGYARYLCHLDNPEKARYNVDDVRAMCGADYSAIIGLPTDKYRALADIMDYIDANEVYSYRALLRYASSERADWYRVLVDCGTLVIKEYLKSAYWEDHSLPAEPDPAPISPR